jgi:hypothetical protein
VQDHLAMAWGEVVEEEIEDFKHRKIQFFIFAIKNKQYFTLNNKENDEQKYSPFVGNSYNDNCRIGFNCLRAY